MKKIEMKYLLTGMLLILFYWILNHFQLVSDGIHAVMDLLSPFLLGGAIAFILNVPMRQIEKHLFQGEKARKLQKYRRLVAYLLTLLLVLLVIALAMLVVVPEIIETGRTLVEQIPEGIDNLIHWMEKYSKNYPQLWESIQQTAKLENLNWNAIITKAGSFLSVGTAGLISGGIGAVSGIVSGVTSFFVGFVFSIYLLFQKEQLASQMRHLIYAVLPDKYAVGLLRVAAMTSNTFSNFLSGQCLEAVILGTMFWLSMVILRLPYALLVGVVIAITALVPIVGAFVGCAVGAFLIAMVNPMQAVFFIILFLVLQQVEGNLIYPRVVGNAVGLPGIWVLVAVSVGGSLYGVLGMLTFIPIVSVCYALLREFVHKRIALQQMASDAAEEKETSSEYQNESKGEVITEEEDSHEEI